MRIKQMIVAPLLQAASQALSVEQWTANSVPAFRGRHQIHQRRLQRPMFCKTGNLSRRMGASAPSLTHWQKASNSKFAYWANFE
jgi:hypothetical protein